MKTKLLLIITLFNFNFLLHSQIPTIEYSTFLGGSGYDYGHAITVDDSGYVYLAGQTSSNNFPTTPGAFDETHNGGADIYLTKLNLDGTDLIYSTYIGGSDFDDTRAVTVNESGKVFLTGTARSSNFPAPTSGAIPGASQGYILQMNANGSKLEYLTKWAGCGKIIIDSEGFLIALGTTNSSSFFVTDSAFDKTYNGENDIFVAKLDIINDSIIFSTFIGGSGNDFVFSNAIAIDDSNNIIISGYTLSDDFPVKGKVFSEYIAGKRNIFITKLNPDGTDIIFSTVLGGSENETIFGLEIDNQNNIYIIGTTYSDDYPVTNNAYDTTYNGEGDAILTKLSPDGSQLIYSTYLGGPAQESGRGVVIDDSGKAYLTGCTMSDGFPVTSDALFNTYAGCEGCSQYGWGDAFLTIVNTDGSDLEYSTFLGGRNDEEAYDIAMDKAGSVYLTGLTVSSNFPVTKNVYGETKKSSGDIYVTKFSFSTQSFILSVTTNSLIINASANSEVSFGIESNTSWSVSSSESWLRINKNSGLNNDSITLIALENSTNNSRTAQVIVSGVGVNSQTITVTQSESTNIKNTHVQNLEIIPNPAQNTLQIEYPGLSEKDAYYKIIDLSGKTVHEGELTGNTIDVSKIERGTYILNLDIDGENLTSKFLIE